MLVKYRIASGNAEHGNYILTAVLGHTFATAVPRMARSPIRGIQRSPAAKGLPNAFDVESSLGGVLPTGKIAAQGRSIVWNALVQDHITKSVWLEVENNATFFRGGSHDGQMQNFVTPGAFYVSAPRLEARHIHSSSSTGGMQIATSRFHTYNHNLIAEMRIPILPWRGQRPPHASRFATVGRS